MIVALLLMLQVPDDAEVTRDLQRTLAAFRSCVRDNWRLSARVTVTDIMNETFRHCGTAQGDYASAMIRGAATFQPPLKGADLASVVFDMIQEKRQALTDELRPAIEGDLNIRDYFRRKARVKTRR